MGAIFCIAMLLLNLSKMPRCPNINSAFFDKQFGISRTPIYMYNPRSLIRAIVIRSLESVANGKLSEL